MRINSETIQTGDRPSVRFLPGAGLRVTVADSPAGQEATVTYGFAALAGHAHYVDAATGSDNNDGTTWASAYATIQAAVDACESGRHDIVYINTGTYDENVTVNGKDYVTLAGVSLNGYGRPDIGASTGTSPALAVTASHGVVCANLRFFSDGLDIHVATNDGNGFVFADCVFDGDPAQAATKALLLLKGNADDDGYTASEGVIANCLFRNSGGYGIAFDTGDAPGNGVGCTHNVIRGCRFISNTAEDIIALDTGGGTYTAQDNLVEGCYIGMGAGKNKATHIDISTSLGAANTGNVFAGCYINDDTVNGTAIKMAGTGSSLIGCYSLDGLIDGDALD